MATYRWLLVTFLRKTGKSFKTKSLVSKYVNGKICSHQQLTPERTV